MREDDSNWFTKWEEQLPSPEDLIPLSHSLISPNLALAFNIQIPNTESPDLSSGATGDESARTLKRPRLVWTPQLHKRFVDAVAHLGIKNAVPKTIMNLMSVDGLTRENVASHLQKYRLYLKRISSGGGGGAGSDPATDRLFASSPVPAHFLHQNRGSNSDHYIPSFVPHLQPPQLHRQIAAAHFGSPINGQFNSPTNVKFDPLLLQTQQQSIHRMSTPSLHSPVGNYVDDLESVNGGRTVLTLFPNRDD